MEKRFWKKSKRKRDKKPMKIRKSIMIWNEWSAVCELFANGAFSADRQIKARHNEVPRGTV